MENWIRVVGPYDTLEILGIKLVGVNADTGKKLLITIGLILLVKLVRWVMHKIATWLLRERRDTRVTFWSRQSIRLSTTLLLIIGIISIWFDDPLRLSTALGLVTAGLAFALQKVVTAVAGYFVILRGQTFNVGDRIRMGGVRGDVIAIDFIKTTIMEMGQPPPVQADDPAVWVESRQYTGHIVVVTNASIFDEPVYNYSRDFPYLWEEMRLPISYTADRDRAERILLDAAEKHTISLREISEQAMAELQRRFFVRPADMKPHVYYRLTDNWLELTVRFITRDEGIRVVKDGMSRDVLKALDEAGIEIASATFEIVGLPPLQIARGGDGKSKAKATPT